MLTVVVAALIAAAPAAGAAAAPTAVFDTTLRVPGTVLRFGMTLPMVERRLATAPATGPAVTPGPPGTSVRKARMRFFGLDSDAQLTFTGDRLTLASFSVSNPSPRDIDYVGDDLARQGYRQRCDLSEGLDRSCEWTLRVRVHMISSATSLTADIEPVRTEAGAPAAASAATGTTAGAGATAAAGTTAATGTKAAMGTTPAAGTTPKTGTKATTGTTPAAGTTPKTGTMVAAGTVAAAGTALAASAAPETLRLGTPGAPDSLPRPVIRDSCRAVRPAVARANGVFGRVGLDVLVDTTGAVIDARVIRSVPMLDSTAVTCARQYRFDPCRLRGRAVRFWTSISIRFVL